MLISWYHGIGPVCVIIKSVAKMRAALGASDSSDVSSCILHVSVLVVWRCGIIVLYALASCDKLAFCILCSMLACYSMLMHTM